MWSPITPGLLEADDKGHEDIVTWLTLFGLVPATCFELIVCTCTLCLTFSNFSRAPSPHIPRLASRHYLCDLLIEMLGFARIASLSISVKFGAQRPGQFVVLIRQGQKGNRTWRAPHENSKFTRRIVRSLSKDLSQ